MTHRKVTAMNTLGIDTSNYTTSVALFDGVEGYNAGRLLEVTRGELGLRQNEALFQHIKRLPELFKSLAGHTSLDGLRAVGASTRPRAIKGSYMPCFLAGMSHAKALAAVLGIPFYPCSHQQGHLAAAAWSAGRLDLLDRPFLAWHLSGGTTELLYVKPEGESVSAQIIGGSSDISAGQLIDRSGVLLNLGFPAGKALDALGTQGSETKGYPVKLQGLTFSLSGMENKVKAMVEKRCDGAAVAGFVLNTVTDVVVRATARAMERYPGLPVLCSGGVASNTVLRRAMVAQCDALFAQPQYSTDNAMGVAILTCRALERGALNHES